MKGLCLSAVGLALIFCLAMAGSAAAVTTEVISREAYTEFRLTEILPGDTAGRYFTLDPEAGTVTFGDGAMGLRPPTGEGAIAPYRRGTGETGNVYPITPAFQPFFIPYAALAPEDDNGAIDLSFVIAGITALTLQTRDEGVYVPEAAVAVPAPPALCLLSLGLACLTIWRRRRSAT